MFHTAGLKLEKPKLKQIFQKANGFKTTSNCLTLDEFQSLMLSPAVDRAFRELLLDIRQRFKYGDFSTAAANVNFLPTDLGLMLGFLYRKSLRRQLAASIVSDKEEHFEAGQSANDISNATRADFMQWASLFHVHDDDTYSMELRSRFKIQALEKRFRLEQDPQKQREANLLFDLSAFFLGRLKEKAQRSEELRRVVDADMIPPMIPPKLAREMRMDSEIDRIPVTMDNLDEIQQLRRVGREAS